MLKVQTYMSEIAVRCFNCPVWGRVGPPMRTLFFFLSCMLFLDASLLPLQAQTSSSHEQIFQYKAADRSAWVLERAKKEGSLTLYTSLAPTEATPLTKEFERKYGIRVEVWRGLSEGVLQRVLNEARA